MTLKDVKRKRPKKKNCPSQFSSYSQVQNVKSWLIQSRFTYTHCGSLKIVIVDCEWEARRQGRMFRILSEIWGGRGGGNIPKHYYDLNRCGV